jgi:hypothetical protein
VSGRCSRAWRSFLACLLAAAGKAFFVLRSASRPGGCSMRRQNWLAVLVVVAIASACTKTVYLTGSPSPSTGSPTTFSPAVSPEESLSPSASPTSALGSREDPVPLGTAAPVGKNWIVKVTSVTKQADDAMHQANMFNQKPQPGSQYVLVMLLVKYQGGGKGQPYYDLDYGISSSSGIVKGSSDAVAPEDSSDANYLFDGDAAEGNVPFLVKSSDVNSSLVLLVSPSFGSTRVVFHL